MGASADKKVPPRHPLQRLARLNEFAVEWCNDNLTAKQAANWSGKFDNNVARFEARFERCGYYDENNLPHGGPSGDRKRRDAADDLVDACNDPQNPLCRYDKSNPLRGIKQITNGFRKWAERYLANDKDGKFQETTSPSSCSCQRMVPSPFQQICCQPTVNKITNFTLCTTSSQPSQKQFEKNNYTTT